MFGLTFGGAGFALHMWGLAVVVVKIISGSFIAGMLEVFGRAAGGRPVLRNKQTYLEALFAAPVGEHFADLFFSFCRGYYVNIGGVGRCKRPRVSLDGGVLCCLRKTRGVVQCAAGRAVVNEPAATRNER